METTNFNGQGSSTNIHTIGSPPFNNTPISTEYKLTERFTRTGPDTLTYQATVKDPVIWTAPWTVELPWQRDESYQFFEYACHEDNSMVRNYIETSRAERANNPESASLNRASRIGGRRPRRSRAAAYGVLKMHRATTIGGPAE